LREVLERCAERNLLLHPETVSVIEEEELDDSVLKDVYSLPEGTVVTPEHLRGNGSGTGPTENCSTSARAVEETTEEANVEKDGGGRKVVGQAETGTGAASDSSPGVSAESGSGDVDPASASSEGRGDGYRAKQVDGMDYDPEFEVLLDATGDSEGEGELDDFRTLFRDRLDRLRKVLENRQGIHPRSIDSLNQRMDREVTVVGMVSSTSRTSNGHLLVRVEDEGGELPCIVLSGDEGNIGVAETLLEDEVVGITGQKRKGSDLLLAEHVMRPDVPSMEPGRGGDAYAAFISDVHVGSRTFMRDELETFFSWLNGELGDERGREIAAKTKFLVIAGDLVDGIGVYPDQEDHLAIKDLRRQYEEAATLLERLPNDLNVIISPGNHDAVRQAEPQPALREEYAEILDLDNVTLVSNPSVVDLDGVKTLIYHGRSLDHLVAELPDADYEDPTGIMRGLLQRRHLAPTYGARTPLSPEREDFLVVDDIPDIFHTGHVHKFGLDSYRGVTMINSGTWQSQTDFQKRMGIEPDPCRAPLINLSTGERKVLRFA